MKTTKRRLFKMLLAAPLAVVAAKAHAYQLRRTYAKIIAEGMCDLPLVVSKRSEERWQDATQAVLDDWENLERIVRESRGNAEDVLA